MSTLSSGMKRASLRTALIVGAIGLTMLLPLRAWAGRIVYVAPPNGIDDTANLQGALDQCVVYGKNCTVQLAAGNYLTKQLVTYNFRGTFKGKGKDKTIVEALPALDVNAFPEPVCKPNTTDCLWPTLIMFVDGDIRISDMSVKITAVPATKPWLVTQDWEIAALLDAVRVTGQYRTKASVDRVAISGMHDDSDTGFLGFNLINGILFPGELSRNPIPFDYYFLSGNFSVTASSFNTMAAGTGADGFFKDSRVVIGGFAAAGNVFEDVLIGVDLESIENSVVEVSHNTVVGSIFASAWAVPWCCWVPTKPSLFLIHDNTFKPTGADADGLVLVDDPTNKWIYALIYNNTVEAQDIGYGGISAYFTNGTTILNNKLKGNGADGIGIWGGTHSAVLGNDVTDFTAVPDFGLAQIVLDGTTTHSTVVCKTSNDTAMNLGTDNKLIGCQEVGGGDKPLKMGSRPSKMGSGPMLKQKPLGR